MQRFVAGGGSFSLTPWTTRQQFSSIAVYHNIWNGNPCIMIHHIARFLPTHTALLTAPDGSHHAITTPHQIVARAHCESVVFIYLVISCVFTGQLCSVFCSVFSCADTYCKQTLLDISYCCTNIVFDYPFNFDDLSLELERSKRTTLGTNWVSAHPSAPLDPSLLT